MNKFKVGDFVTVTAPTIGCGGKCTDSWVGKKLEVVELDDDLDAHSICLMLAEQPGQSWWWLSRRVKPWTNDTAKLARVRKPKPVLSTKVWAVCKGTEISTFFYSREKARKMARGLTHAAESTGDRYVVKRAKIEVIK